MGRRGTSPHTTTARAGLALALALGAVAAVLSLAGADPAAGQVPRPYTITVTPTSGLVDGQAVDIDVQAAAGSTITATGTVYICRPDTTYTTTLDVNPILGGKCPNVGVTSSASQPLNLGRYPDGSRATGRIRVGVGTVAWGPATDPQRYRLSCDPSNPCLLVTTLRVNGILYYDSSTLLTFSEIDPIGACGGADPSVLSSTGPDRLLNSWANWTQQKCEADGTRAASQAIFSGEGEGLSAYEAGVSDFTYSAIGDNVPGTAEGERASVMVPVALNAAVVGVLGGYIDPTPDWPEGRTRPFGDLRLTLSELATLFGQGGDQFRVLAPQVQGRNGQLALSGLTNSDRSNPLMPAGQDSISWVISRAFDQLAGSEWRTGPVDVVGNPPNVQRGVVESFATADPPFSIAYFELYSAQSQLKRVAALVSPSSNGPIWILTDYATAQALDIPTVAIQNWRGEFVQPTAESLAAAATDLERQADGTYLPAVNPDTAGAYPLTFLEQAVVPAEPLVTEDCTPRSGSQAVLASWLAYITGPGQGDLPEGMVPLTPALTEAAATARGQVGQQATSCTTPTTTTTTGPTTATTSGPVSTPTTRRSTVPTVAGTTQSRSNVPSIPIPGASSTTPTTSGTSDPDDDEGDDEDVELASVDVGSGRTASAAGPSLALLALALLGALGGSLSRRGAGSGAGKGPR